MSKSDPNQLGGFYIKSKYINLDLK